MPPRLECSVRERYGFAANVPIDVVVHAKAFALPVAPKQPSTVVVHDVLFERKGNVPLGTRAHQLELAAECEDVIPHDVFAAIVLVETGALCEVHNVILDEHL